MDRRGGYRDRRRAPAASTPEVLEIIPLMYSFSTLLFIMIASLLRSDNSEGAWHYPLEEPRF